MRAAACTPPRTTTSTTPRRRALRGPFRSAPSLPIDRLVRADHPEDHRGERAQDEEQQQRRGDGEAGGERPSGRGTG